jgi:hypothetical protein
LILFFLNLGIALDSNLTHGWNSTVPRKKMAWEYNNNKLGKPCSLILFWGQPMDIEKCPKLHLLNPAVLSTLLHVRFQMHSTCALGMCEQALIIEQCLGSKQGQGHIPVS